MQKKIHTHTNRYQISNFSLDDKSAIEIWDNFIKSHPNGTPYHLSCWLRAIYETYSFKPNLYTIQNYNNELVGVLPCFASNGLFGKHKITSLPFSDNCGPLTQNYIQEGKLIQHLIDENQNKIKFLEIRSDLRNGISLHRYNYYKHHILTLNKNPDDLKLNIDKKTIQYSIRKSKKAGVKIVEENSYFGMEQFHRLHELTRKKHGVPCPPFLFFKKLFENIISQGYGFILLAKYDKQVIAAGIFLKLNDSIYYKYNASNPQFLKSKAPNHLLTWQAIKEACLNGYKIFDFGRTSPENSGLMRYKEMWGAKRLDLPYYYYPQNDSFAPTESSILYRIFRNFWRKTPSIIVNKIGPKIYKLMN